MLLELWPFTISGHLILLLSCAKHKFRTTYANVLKFHIWIPHEKKRWPVFLSHLRADAGAI